MALRPLIAGLFDKGVAFNTAIPGPIGGTTPAAITGTTITATTKFVAADSALVLSGATSTTTGIGITSGFLYFYVGGTQYAVLANGQFAIGTAIAAFTNGAITGIAGVNSFAPRVGGTLFNHYTSVSTTHTDGTEDDLFSNSISAFGIIADGTGFQQIEHVNFVSSVTASRRLRKYFGGTIIFDSGVLTLSLGADFGIVTNIIRESSTVVRCIVSVTSTSASSLPYVTYTRITGLDLGTAKILKTTGIAAGTGAASADIANTYEKTLYLPQV